MSVVLFLLCACSATLAVPTAEYYELEEAELHFERFIQEHGKNYADENEKQVRFQIFKQNLEDANNMNMKSRHAVFGITQFMDLTAEEFVNTNTCVMPAVDVTWGFCPDLFDDDIPDVKAPESFDWREHGAVTRVKSQGQCGSCFAFGSTGHIEGQYAIKYKKLVELSEQQIVDCDAFNRGCIGGRMDLAFTAIMAIGGIVTEDSYPYIHKQEICNFDPSKVAVKIFGCNSYNLTSQDALKRLVYKVGPIPVAVQAKGFQKYRGGVISEETCDQGDVNHAVLIVGYGTTEDGVPYWLVKNSWDTSFGEDGYIKIQRGEGAHSCSLMNDFMASARIE